MSKTEAAYNRLTSDLRSKFFPGGLEQAERAVSSIEYIIGKIDDYNKVLDLYTDMAVRVGIMGFDDDRANITLQMRYGDIVPKDLSITLIQCIRRLFQNYQFLYHDKSEADMFSAFISYADSYQRNAARKNDAINTPDFGTDPNNPIYANSAWGSYEYLNKLYSDKFIPLLWKRVGSVPSENPDPIDMYQLYLPDGKKYLSVYINMYSKETSIYCPKKTRSYELKEIPDRSRVPAKTVEQSNIATFPGKSLFCENCGRELPLDSVFCQYCGKKIILQNKTESTISSYASTREESSKTAQSISNNIQENPDKFHRSLPEKKKKKHPFFVFFLLVLILAGIYFGCLQLSYVYLEKGDIDIAKQFILSRYIYEPFFPEYINRITNTYVITFNKQGGQGGSDFVIAEFDSPISSYLKPPTRDGYRFIGYYDSPDSTTKQYYTAYMTNTHKWDYSRNGELYAHWEENSTEVIEENVYRLTFDKQGGSGGTDYIDIRMHEKMPSGLLPPTRDGYRFTGYFSSESLSALRYYDENMESRDKWSYPGNRTFYAHWEKIDSGSTIKANSDEQSFFTITFDKNGGTSGTDSVAVAYNEKLPSGLLPPKREGYRFTGYYLSATSAHKYYDENMESKDVWTFTNDRTFFAHWVEIDLKTTTEANRDEQSIYTITFDKSGGTGGTDSVAVAYNEKLPSGLLPPKREGYRFTGYYLSATSAHKYYDENMESKDVWTFTNDRTFFAHWVEIDLKTTTEAKSDE